ncbi:MAG: hypothetical protein ACOZAN_01215 [Patescibacteria group bacterium]
MSERERADGRGLTGEDHLAANQTAILSQKEREAAIDAMRDKYQGDDVAAQYLDAYRGGNEYAEKMAQFIQALKDGDTETEEQLAQWFDEKYPALSHLLSDSSGSDGSDAAQGFSSASNESDPYDNYSTDANGPSV